MQDFQFEEAQRQINGFLWGEFCDWYIELAKIRLRSTTDKFPTPLVILVHVLETSLRLLHPFMPFVTEELWQNLKRGLASDWQVGDSIMVAPYPEAEASAGDPEAERIMATIIEIIRAVRNARTEYKVPASQWVEVRIYGGELAPSIIPYQSVIETLARVKSLVVQKTRRSRAKNENALVSVLSEVEVVIPMASVIDMEEEKRRLQGEIVQIQTEITRLETRLQDNAFLTRAPVAVVNKERDRLAVVVDKLARLEQELARL